MRATLVVRALGLLVGVACSNSGADTPEFDGAAAGGVLASAGSQATGGNRSVGDAGPAGGVPNAGGVSTTGNLGGLGGTTATGGTAGAAGASPAGGSVNTGGSAGTGGEPAAGGVPNTSGSAGTGGEPAAGGSVNTGGSVGTGGEPAAGGSVNTGGSVGTGGEPAAGGSVNTGGSAGMGGEPAVGGSVNTGGSAGMGGEPAAGGATSSSNKLRVMVTSDIGGTDTDDQQSMVHFLVYADRWDVEGLISSPWGDGRKEDILELIDLYEQDYPNLITHSDYPTPEYLRSVTMQGATEKALDLGYGTPTEGSEWIAARAKADDPRPLWITVWGAPDDLAQALHDHPEITPKLRVYWIAGPNRALNANSSRYMSENHRDLWIIEADETYRGFFNGGDTSDGYGNSDWPAENVAGHGALGDYFMRHRSDIKMGDTPAVLYTIDNALRAPEDPTQPGWGGAFVPQVEPNRPCSSNPARDASEACCGGARPNCWMDNTDPAIEVGGYSGAETVAMHRKAWLDDWGEMMDRARAPRQYSGHTTSPLPLAGSTALSATPGSR